jgi:hypothetical protein
MPESDWTEIDVEYPEFQRSAWRNTVTGDILVVEGQAHPGSRATEYYTHVLESGFGDDADPEPKETLANAVSSESAAVTAAREYRESAEC